MFHVHYINYDNKIAHLLNTFLKKKKKQRGVANARHRVDMPLLLRFQIYANLLQLVQTRSKDYKYNFTSINYTFDLRLFTVMIPNESTL